MVGLTGTVSWNPDSRSQDLSSTRCTVSSLMHICTREGPTFWPLTLLSWSQYASFLDLSCHFLLFLQLQPFSIKGLHSMEGAANLRYLGGFLSHFFNCPLIRGVFPAIRNLTFRFPIVAFPLWISTEFNYFMCFLHQGINFIWKVLVSLAFPDHGMLSVMLRCSINVCCMDE